jgi:hypothetical protein
VTIRLARVSIKRLPTRRRASDENLRSFRETRLAPRRVFSSPSANPRRGALRPRREADCAWTRRTLVTCARTRTRAREGICTPRRLFLVSRVPSSVSSVSSREPSSLGFRNGLRHSAHHATRLARRMFSSVPSSSSTRGSTPPQRGIEPGTVSSYAASPATGCPANAQCARIWWNRPASVSDATASVSTSSVDSDLFFSTPLKDARSSSRLGTYATGTTHVSAGLKPQSSVFVVPSSSSTKARLGSCPLHDFSVETSTSARPSSPTLKRRFTTNPSFSTRPRRSARYVLRFSAPGRTSAALALALALLPFAKSHTPLTGWSTRFTAKSGSGSSRARFRIATQQFSPDKPGPMPANVGTPAGLSTGDERFVFEQHTRNRGTHGGFVDVPSD